MSILYNIANGNAAQHQGHTVQPTQIYIARIPLVRRAAPHRCRLSADTARARLRNALQVVSSHGTLSPRLPHPFRPSSDRCRTAHPRCLMNGSTIPEAETRARRHRAPGVSARMGDCSASSRRRATSAQEQKSLDRGSGEGGAGE